MPLRKRGARDQSSRWEVSVERPAHTTQTNSQRGARLFCAHAQHFYDSLTRRLPPPARSIRASRRARAADRLSSPPRPVRARAPAAMAVAKAESRSTSVSTGPRTVEGSRRRQSSEGFGRAAAVAVERRQTEREGSRERARESRESLGLQASRLVSDRDRAGRVGQSSTLSLD